MRACTLEAWIISGVNRAEMTGWMASGVPKETQTVFTCSHRGYVSAHKLSSVVAKCTDSAQVRQLEPLHIRYERTQSLVLAQPAGVVDSCTHRHPSRGTSARRYQPLEPHPTPFCGRSATHCLCREGELWSVVRVTNSVGFDAKLKAGCSQV